MEKQAKDIANSITRENTNFAIDPSFAKSYSSRCKAFSPDPFRYSIGATRRTIRAAANIRTQ
jgi:hypothetical protein